MKIDISGEQVKPMVLLRYCTLVALAIVFSAQAIHAQSLNDPNFNTLTVYWANDALASTDRDYTNGIKLTWSTPYRFDKDKKRLPKWDYPIIGSLPFVNDTTRQRSTSFSIGQDIYTPEDLLETELIKDDRPYAGILYLGIGFHSKKNRRKENWGLNVGVVGPHAYAEQTQNTIHDLIGSDRANGWENQLEDEFAFEVTYETQWRLLEKRGITGFGYDFIPHLGARLGNVLTYINTGAELRFGWNMTPNFGTCPIRPGCETDSAITIIASKAEIARPQRGLHFFLAADGRMMFRDIFLDGNTIRDSHKVDKKSFVADIMGGIGINLGKVNISYAYVYRTKQFDTQDRAQIFGSFTFSYSF